VYLSTFISYKTINYWLIILLYCIISFFSGILADPKTIIMIHVFFLFFSLIFQSILIDRRYLWKIILLALLIRVSLYGHILTNDEFTWKLSALFSMDDTLNWFTYLIGYVLESFNDGIIPPINYLETFGASNGVFYSYISGFFLFILNAKSFQDGLVYLPLLNFVFFTLSLYYFNKLVIDVSHSSKIAVVALCFLAFSPQIFFWNFFALKHSFLLLLIVLLTYNISRFISTRKLMYFLIYILLSIIMFKDRIYLGYFSFITLFFVTVAMYGDGSFFRGLKRPKVFTAFIVLIIVLYPYIHDLIVGNYVYFNRSAVISETGLLQLLRLENNPFFGFLRILITPLPFRVTEYSSIDLIMQFSFFTQVPLVIFSFYGLVLLYKYNRRYLYIVMPLYLFYFIFSFYSPGANRVRDTLFPLLVLLASIGFCTFIERIDKYKQKRLEALLRQN